MFFYFRGAMSDDATESVATQTPLETVNQKFAITALMFSCSGLVPTPSQTLNRPSGTINVTLST